MAKYLNIFNLGLIITENCNLRCGHCMRGHYSNSSMSDEVIDATLDQITSIGVLSICGGEPLLALDQMEKIFKRIKRNNIWVDEVNVTINGTIYSDRFLSLVSSMDGYLHVINNTKKQLFHITISNDQYHDQELERLHLKKLYLENIKKYAQTKYFNGLKLLSMKPFNEGNAAFLDESVTVPLRPMQTFITYTNDGKHYDENGICLIGSLVTVNVNGTVTECDASVLNQEIKYNYGNVTEESIEDIVLRNGTLVLKPRKFERLVEKERKRFLSYNK